MFGSGSVYEKSAPDGGGGRNDLLERLVKNLTEEEIGILQEILLR